MHVCPKIGVIKLTLEFFVKLDKRGVLVLRLLDSYVIMLDVVPKNCTMPQKGCKIEISTTWHQLSLVLVITIA